MIFSNFEEGRNLQVSYLLKCCGICCCPGITSQ